jgi:hypothetical protein
MSELKIVPKLLQAKFRHLKRGLLINDENFDSLFVYQIQSQYHKVKKIETPSSITDNPKKLK